MLLVRDFGLGPCAGRP